MACWDVSQASGVCLLWTEDIPGLPEIHGGGLQRQARITSVHRSKISVCWEAAVPPLELPGHSRALSLAVTSASMTPLQEVFYFGYLKDDLVAWASNMFGIAMFCRVAHP